MYDYDSFREFEVDGVVYHHAGTRFDQNDVFVRDMIEVLPDHREPCDCDNDSYWDSRFEWRVSDLDFIERSS